MYYMELMYCTAKQPNLELKTRPISYRATRFGLWLCWGRENYRGKYHCTIDLLFGLIQTSQTGGQGFPPLVFPGL